MAFKNKGKYWAYGRIDNKDIGYSGSMSDIFDLCKEYSLKYNIPLSEFSISTYEKYGDSEWEITFVRPATPEEIKDVDAEEKRRAEMKRQQYEALKKEFER